MDTNVLVALAHPGDSLHERATADFGRAARGRDIGLLSLHLAEATYVLQAPFLRGRLRCAIEEFEVEAFPLPQEAGLRAEVFDWLAKYADHSPDFADAVLAVLAGRDSRIRVWTYDREFATIWRRPNGGRIPLAIRP